MTQKSGEGGIVIGLTGGIATGKSTVARMFKQLGAVVVSADDMARRAVAPGEPALRDIRNAFGDDVVHPDGTLDREKLAAVVFTDEDARRRLEAITHPHIRRMMRERIAAGVAAGHVVVAEIPLLFESEPARALVGPAVVVYADAETQKERLMVRDGLTESEAEARMAAQLPMADKVARADYVIDNGGSEAHTREQVHALWDAWHEERELTR